MARGSQNGISNNPKGRPDGAKQKLSLSIREKIIEKVTDDFDKYFEALDSLSEKDYVRCMTELFKLIIPRPLNEEEANAAQVNSELIKRLFNK
jgi:hypothetical protein